MVNDPHFLSGRKPKVDSGTRGSDANTVIVRRFGSTADVDRWLVRVGERTPVTADSLLKGA